MTVLCGVDGSPESWAALDWAVADAGHRQEPVEVLIVPSDLSQESDGRSVPVEDIITRIESLYPGVAVRVLPGTPAAALQEAVGTTASALVLGNSGHGAFRSWLEDSVARELINSVPLPVVVVPAEAGPNSTGPVVIGVDRASADKVLEYGFTHAARTGAAVRLVSSWEVPIVDTFGAAAVATSDISASVQAEIEALAMPYSDRHPAVPVTAVTEFGSPQASLAAESKDAGLLVVGGHQRGWLGQLFTGSVAGGVLHRVHVPVAVVPLD